MKVNFLLPISPVPTGGPKIVFEYANRMVEDNMEVTIIYPISLRHDKVQSASFFGKLNMRKKLISEKMRGKYSARDWFPLNTTVREKLVPCLKEKFIPDADITYATSWETAEWLNTYTRRKGRKMYFIQHYEDWSGTRDQVDKTWKMPFQKIVISRWLREYADSLGETSSIVNNGLDFHRYHIEPPIEARNPFQLIMLYHPIYWKGSADGLTAIELVKKEHAAIRLILFGTSPRPALLPSWIEYHQKPSNLKELYNRASIFFSPSWGEGWALPPAEAMQCGCACILTDIGGHKDYGENGKDLLLVEPRNPEAMAAALLQLITHDELRQSLARSGNATIQQFTWERAYNALKHHMIA